MTATTGLAVGTGAGTGAGTRTDTTTRLFGPRGRHRKPRPRKVLLAAGGLALAAGALSLVRLTPDAGVGGFGATETGPQAAPGTDKDRATNAATVDSVPQANPSSTRAMGEISATESATAVPLPLTTTPDAPNTQAPKPPPTASTTPHAPPPTTAPPPPAPPPPTSTPQPTHTTQPAPAPTPAPAPAPGLCVPIIGLCVQQRG
ncbi:hypothetical protein [Streptomyces sp. NPDC050759]|uniref:hypothetical protein n=1 Tax=Streptomyces sp. NPDC050759 TaxID=3365635 RepID=UPI0037A6C084